MTATAPQIDYTAWRPIEDYRPKIRARIAAAAKDLLWQARGMVEALEALTDAEKITTDALEKMADEYERSGRGYGAVYGFTSSSLHKDLNVLAGELEDAEAEMGQPCCSEGCAATATMQRGWGDTLELACAEHGK